MKSFLFTTAVSILFSLSLFAQAIQMNPLKGPEGGVVSKFKLNAQGDILAVQNRVGVRVSRDGGNTWLTPNGSFSSSSTAVHPDGSFYGMSIFATEIYRIPPTSMDVEKIEFDSLNSSSLVHLAIDESGNLYGVTHNDEVFRSLDGGRTWSFLVRKTWTRGLQELYAPPGDYIYFKVKGGVFLQELVYRMRKDNFEFELSFNSRNDRIYTFSENPAGGLLLNNLSGVFSSPDGSEGSWVRRSSGYQTVALTGASNGDLTIAALSGYFRSTDLGVTWTQLPGPDVSQYVGAVTMDYDEVREKYYVRNQSSDLFNFYKVEPDFSNWEAIAPEKNQPPVKKVLTDGAGNIYAGIALSLGSEIEGFYRSEDGGDTFAPYLLPNGSEIRAISEGANEVLFAFGYNDTIYRSPDYGVNWTPTMPVNLQFNAQAASSRRFSYVKSSSDGTVLANFGNGLNRLWLSEDNGDTWAELSGQGFYETHIDIHPSGDIYGSFFQNNNGRLVVKYDRQTALWDTIYTDGSSITGVTVSETGLILAAKNGDYAISEDEGKSFQEVRWSNFNYITSAANGYLVAAQGADNLVLSKNNGLSWEVAYTYQGLGNYRDFHFDKNNILYAAFDGDFIHKSGQIIFEDNFIVGNVWYDRNEDCAYDSSEFYLKDIIVSAEGMDTFYVTTRSDGRFVIPVPAGDYDVSISLGGDLWMPCDSLQAVTLTGISDTAFIDFPVKPKMICPKLSVDISSPFFRRCFTNTYYVNYCNDGTEFADSAYVEIMLDPRMTITSTQIPWSNQQGNIYTFQIGDLDIFSCGEFSFTVEHDCDSIDLGETICAEANIFPDDICAPSAANWSQASLEISVECEGDSAIFKIKNVGTGNMIDSRNYIIIEDFVIMRLGDPFQLDAGEELLIPVETMGQTIHLETQQVVGHPGISRPSATIEKCGVQPHSLGFFNQFGHNDANSNIDIECREAIGAYDPNDKNAVPTGGGTERIVQPDGQIEYLIRFQNTGTDTAFTVQIFDTLSRNLDVKSFDPVSSSHDFTYEIFDRGVVKFKFENIMLPDSFINEPASNGFIKYKIDMNRGLLPTEEILNTADIYFDYNAPIRTNTTLHTIEEEWVLVETGEVFLPKSEVKVFPNPFSESATLELISEELKTEFTCQVFDMTGRLILVQNSENQRVTLSRKGLDSGFYFYTLRLRSGQEIENEVGAIASGKLIVK